jgi:chromosome segregation ATPase
MLAVLESEARNRRQENADLRSHICGLQEDLEEERKRVLQLRREPAESSSGPSKKDLLATIRAKETEARLALSEELDKSRAEIAWLRQQLDQAEVDKTRLRTDTEEASRDTSDSAFEEELEKLRSENLRLRQRLDAAATLAENDARHSFERKLAAVREENERMREAAETFSTELEQLRSENAELRRQSLGSSRNSRSSGKTVEDWDVREAAHKAKACQMSIELANITQLVMNVLEESHEPLSGARSACVQLEAALNNGKSSRGETPPAIFDLKPGDVSGLATIPEVLRYMSGVLVQASAMDPKWIKTIRYHFC